MRKLLIGAAAVAVAVGGTAPANDLTLGGGAVTPASITSDVFFYDPTGNITITGVTETAFSSTVTCALSPNDLQIGRATGYENMNGLALSNGYLEDLDDDGAPGGFGCFDADGGTVGDCSFDATLSAALGVAYGGTPFTGPATSNAASVEVMFTAATATTLDVSYNFMTLETPTDPSFFDSFGIIYDGVVVAGGSTNAGAPAGTDPWVLTPGTPGEFQSVACPSGFCVLPAHETGIRTVTLAVSPGPHTLSFHIADGGPGSDCGAGGAPMLTACDIVPSVLIVGAHTFESGNPGSVTGAPQISRIGHPSPTGPPDLQITLSGAPPLSPTILVLGIATLTPTTFPLIAPLEVFLAPIVFVTGATDAAGSAAAPSTPPTINPGVVGMSVLAQYFGIDLSGVPTVFNTKALRVDFGL